MISECDSIIDNEIAEEYASGIFKVLDKLTWVLDYFWV